MSLTIETLYTIFTSIPKDGYSYKWLVNYEQFYEIATLQDGNGRYVLEYRLRSSSEVPTLFGMVVEIDNRDEWIRVVRMGE